MTRIRSMAPVVVLCALLANSATASVLGTVVRSSDNEESTGLGVQVAQEYVLTTHDLVSGASQVLVQAGPTSTQSHAEVKATDPETGLTLLFVPGLNGEAVTVASEAPKPGRFVHLKSFDGTTYDGVFVETVEDASQQRRYWFTSSSDQPESGSPVMNGCDQLIAVGSAGSHPAGVGGSRGVLSGTFPALVAFLLENEVRFRSAPAPCPSLQDQNTEVIAERARLQEEKESLEQEKESLAKEIEELETAITEGEKKSQQELESLEARRRELASTLKQKDAELTAKVSEAEAMTKKQAEMEARLQESQEALQERQDELNDLRQREEAANERASLLQRLLIVAGAAVAIALLVVAVVVSRKRRPELQPAGQLPGADVDESSRPSRTNPGREVGQQEPVPTALTGGVPVNPQPRGGDGDPVTRIAGGFRPPPVQPPRPQPQDPAPAADGGALMADNPVVGWLVVVDGPGKGAEIVVGSGQNSVGRGADARVRIDFGDEEVSRGAHAIVTYDYRGNGFFLDNGTGTNLTYMNGEALMEPVPLENGSEFKIGQTTLRFVPFCDDSFRWSDENDRQSK